MLPKPRFFVQFICLILIKNVSARLDRQPNPDVVARMLSDKTQPLVLFVNSDNNVNDNQLALSERVNDRNEREYNELERDRNDLDRGWSERDRRERDRYQLDRNELDRRERFGELGRNDRNNLLRYDRDRNGRLRSVRDRNERAWNDLDRNERDRNERHDFELDRNERDRNERDRNDWNRNERNWNERDRNEGDRNDLDRNERDRNERDQIRGNRYERSRNTYARNRIARSRFARNRERKIQRTDLNHNENELNEDRDQRIDHVPSLSDAKRAENDAYLFYNLLRSASITEQLDPEAADRFESTKELLKDVLRQRCDAKDDCQQQCKPNINQCEIKCQKVFDSLDACNDIKDVCNPKKDNCKKGRTMPPYWLRSYNSEITK